MASEAPTRFFLAKLNQTFVICFGLWFDFLDEQQMLDKKLAEVLHMEVWTSKNIFKELI